MRIPLTRETAKHIEEQVNKIIGQALEADNIAPGHAHIQVTTDTYTSVASDKFVNRYPTGREYIKIVYELPDGDAIIIHHNPDTVIYVNGPTRGKPTPDLTAIREQLTNAGIINPQ